MALDPNYRPTAELSRSTQASLGLPQNFRRATPFPFAGTNQTDDRSAIQEQEFFWLENLLKIGNGKLRALYDVGIALYTVTPPRQIVSFFWFNIGPVDYVAVFLDNGTAIQVRRSDGAQTVMSATPNTFYVAGGQLPACCPSGGNYLLIANNNKVNDYWIWDGQALFTAGTLGPLVTITTSGSEYSSVPTVTVVGGTGGFATAVASIVNGSVTAVRITNPGISYSPNDVVQLVFSGGGSDNGAILFANLTSGVVDNIVITNGGAGYSSAPLVTITGGGGAGATADAVIDGGVVTGVVITSGGSGYIGNPVVFFTGGGSPSEIATGYVTITSGEVTSISVTDGGSGYVSTPLLEIVGGGGSGATAIATVTAGAISAVTVTAGGAGYISTPQVIVQGGANKDAHALATLMPFGVSGNYIETYQSRVWLPHPFQPGQTYTGGIFNVSAPGSLTDFATSDGGLEFTSNDRYLRASYTAMRQANGYLYAIGDSSISVISNVQTSGNPPSTTFSYQNADPQVGSGYPNSVVDFGRTILLSNRIGVYGIFGGSAVKVSNKLDRLFQNAVFPGNAAGTPCVTPSAATAVIFDTKVSVQLMTILDPFTKTPRNAMIMWNEKEWFVAASLKNLIFIGGLETGSSLYAYGTDGTALYPLFDTPSADLPKILASRYWGMDAPEILKEAQRFYVVGESFDADPIEFFWGTDFAGSQADGALEGEGSILSPNNVEGSVSVPVLLGGGTKGKSLVAGMTDDVTAPLIGFKVSTTSPDFEINNVALAYIPAGSIY